MVQKIWYMKITSGFLVLLDNYEQMKEQLQTAKVWRNKNEKSENDVNAVFGLSNIIFDQVRT